MKSKWRLFSSYGGFVLQVGGFPPLYYNVLLLVSSLAWLLLQDYGMAVFYGWVLWDADFIDLCVWVCGAFEPYGSIFSWSISLFIESYPRPSNSARLKGEKAIKTTVMLSRVRRSSEFFRTYVAP